MTANNGDSRRVIVVGAGFAGLGAAFALRRYLNPDDQVTVITPDDVFVFSPSLVWAALGRTSLRSTFSLLPALRSANIELITSWVCRVQPEENVVRTERGEFSYDKLIIATGGRPDTGRIPGLAGEFREASWIVSEDSALEAHAVLEELFEDPGPLIVGAAQGASYISAAYEIALALDTTLRQRGMRDRVPMTFATAEPYLGHLGIGQATAGQKLRKLFAERDIETRVGVGVNQVSRGEVTLSTGERVPAHAIVIMPPLTGAVDIWKSAGLTDERGSIPITPEYRHEHFPDIYAAGVACHFATPIPPLGYALPPHTAYLSLHMGRVAGRNAAAALGAGTAAPHPLPRLIDVRVLDGGNVGLLLTSRGRETLRHTAATLPGTGAHALKSAIERCLVWRLRTGRINA